MLLSGETMSESRTSSEPTKVEEHIPNLEDLAKGLQSGSRTEMWLRQMAANPPQKFITTPF